MKVLSTTLRAFSGLLILLGAAAQAAQAAEHNYYVTVDGRPTLTFGTYAGQANPNSGRLTLLYAHWNDATPSSNHFHGIGVYSLTGPAVTPTVLDTSGNNRLPETYTAQAPLTLKAGSGAYAGKLVSGENGEHYSDLSLLPGVAISPLPVFRLMASISAFNESAY